MNYIEIHTHDKDLPIILSLDGNKMNVSYMYNTPDERDAEVKKIRVLNTNEDFALKDQWELVKNINANNIIKIKVVMNDNIVLYEFDDKVYNIVYSVDIIDQHFTETLFIAFTA